MNATGKPTDIEFPCEDYPIKVIGDTAVEFTARVLTTLDALGVRYNEAGIRQADSRAGRFLSLTVPVVAESEEQLKALNRGLREIEFVRMVL